MPLTRIKNTAIGDGGITTAKLADGSVTTVKVADDAVNSAKIGVDVIAAEDLAANSVTVSEISDGAVTGAKLADNLNYDSGTLYLDSTNNRVIVGDTSANEKFKVVGNIEVYNDDTDGYIWFHDAGTRSWSIGSDQSTGKFLIAYQQNLLGSERLSITSSGNLIVGNSSPPATGTASLVAGDRTILGDVVNVQSLYSNNAYYDGSNWRYYRNDEYSSIRMFDGKIFFHTGNAGTAGNVITNMDGYERRVTIDGTQNGGSSRTQMYIEDSYLVSHARNVYFAENSTPQFVTTGWVDTALSLNNVFIPNHVRVMPFWLYGVFRNNGMSSLNHTGFRLRVTGGSISGSAYIGDGGWGFGIHQLVGTTIGTNWNTFCNHVNLLDFDVNNNQAGLTAGSTYNFTVQVKDAFTNGSDLVISGEANGGQATYAPFNCTLIIV